MIYLRNKKSFTCFKISVDNDRHLEYHEHMKKPAIKEKQIFFRDDKDTYKLLEIIAGEQERTVSNLVRKYVHEGIMQDSRKRKKAS